MSTRKPKAERLIEYVSGSAPLAVDEAAGVIRGVRVLGLQSKNGRVYKREAVTSAIGLYEGAKVNVDHSRKGENERSYTARIGILKGVTQESDGGLRADLHYNPKHALAEQLVWDAKNAPSNVGLSHNVLGRTKREGASVVVESIERVLSVDLVADPATTLSLFEQTETENTESETMDYAALTLDEIKKHRPDLAEAIVNESASLAESRAKSEADASELQSLRESLAAYRAKEALAAVDAEIESLIKEHKLPAPAATDAFKSVLREAKDKPAREAIVKTLAESLAATPSGAKPKSKEQSLTEGAVGESLDGKSFAARLVA